MRLHVLTDGICIALILRRAHHEVERTRRDCTTAGLALDLLPLLHKPLIIVALRSSHLYLHLHSPLPAHVRGRLFHEGASFALDAFQGVFSAAAKAHRSSEFAFGALQRRRRSSIEENADGGGCSRSRRRVASGADDTRGLYIWTHT